MAHIAFDIGGTSMRVALATAEGLGKVKKVPTPEDPREGVALLASLARECAGGDVEKVAGGFPGSVLDGHIHDAPNLPRWKDFSFGGELSQALSGAAVSVTNDADIAALGEATYGAGKGKRVVGYVGVGTGVGGGRIVNGAIDTGLYGLEPGHQIIDTKNNDDLESFVSGRAFEKRYGVNPKDAPRSAYDEITPLLAIGLYNTMLHWSPDVLVLGGSMIVGVNGYDMKAVVSAVKAIPMKTLMRTEIVTAELGDAAGLHGARALLHKA